VGAPPTDKTPLPPPPKKEGPFPPPPPPTKKLKLLHAVNDFLLIRTK